jgi:hypothetical protein
MFEIETTTAAAMQRKKDSMSAAAVAVRVYLIVHRLAPIEIEE